MENILLVANKTTIILKKYFSNKMNLDNISYKNNEK